MTNTNYNDGKWHVWSGGECPVHPESVVEVALTDYSPLIDTADQWFWEKDKSRIIAFRVIKEHVPARNPRTWFAVGKYLYDTEDHAQEVIDRLAYSGSKAEIVRVKEDI